MGGRNNANNNEMNYCRRRREKVLKATADFGRHSKLHAMATHHLWRVVVDAERHCRGHHAALFQQSSTRVQSDMQLKGKQRTRHTLTEPVRARAPRCTRNNGRFPYLTNTSTGCTTNPSTRSTFWKSASRGTLCNALATAHTHPHTHTPTASVACVWQTKQCNTTRYCVYVSFLLSFLILSSSSCRP